MDSPWWMEALSNLGIGLMIANWQWDKWGGRVRRCVPGSLHHAHALERRRLWRWPGFLFWPAAMPGWAFFVGQKVAEMSWWAPLLLLLLVGGLFSLRADWRKLRRELDEDEDDPFNKGKRKLRRLARQAARSLQVLAPAPSPI